MQTFSKTISVLLFFFCSISTYGTDLFVYPNAQGSDFDNIQSAIDAASDGDHIYIDTFTYIGNVVIDKPLSLYPLHKGGMYTINGSLTLQIQSQEKMYIQGLNGGAVSTNGSSVNDTASIILNGCYFSSSVNLSSQENISSYLYYCTFNSSVNVYECELIGNDFNNTLNIYTNGQNSNFNKIKIYANSTGVINISSSYFCDIHIANNYIQGIGYFSGLVDIDGSASSSYSASIIFENNTVYHTTSNTSSSYNIVLSVSGEFVFVRNNYFQTNSNYTRYINIYASILDYQYNFCNYSLSVGNGTITTNANNTYNTTLTYSTAPLSLGVVTSTAGIDAGSPLPECRDIDNSPNNIGTYGGPHSWSNYHNASTSMAQILDLEMPYYKLILPGASIDVKSKAIHKNE